MIFIEYVFSAMLRLVGIGILFFSATVAHAGFNSFNASPNTLFLNAATTVKFIADIQPDSKLINNGVRLLRESNGVFNVVGTMLDDGSGGDDVANDNKFTLVSSVQGNSLGAINFKASAAYKGVIKRLQSSTLPLQIVANTNTPPIANAGAKQTVALDSAVVLDGSASSDPEGNSLTYTWSLKQVPQSSIVVLSSVTAVNPSFTPDKTGTYVVQLVVNDGITDSTPSEVEITVMTQKQEIQLLEEQGVLPKLDRSTDIQGPDVNANSIRDDVEAYIETHYTSPPQRAAIEQLAQVVQAAMLVDKTDAASLKAVSLKSSKAVHCLYDRFNVNAGAKHPAAVIEEIESISTNTKARLLAYLEYSKALDGSAGSVPEGDTCE